MSDELDEKELLGDEPKNLVDGEDPLIPEEFFEEDPDK